MLNVVIDGKPQWLGITKMSHYSTYAVLINIKLRSHCWHNHIEMRHFLHFLVNDAAGKNMVKSSDSCTQNRNKCCKIKQKITLRQGFFVEQKHD